ncbi:hypothetical protein [Nonomuraea longicatena]|uniref:Uncharacterized protein n=1 Tax=Nonomuraea longicatena TaxID=83682 RepID=A0ABP4A2I7_9ACTN
MRANLAATALAVVVGAGVLALAPVTLAAPAAAAAAASATAQAAPAFNASGVWQIFQSNGPTVTINLTQDGSGRLFGSASFGGTVGTIEQGAVDGTGISFVIGWSDGAQGRYTGWLGADRHLSGTTVNLNNPSQQANWFTTRTF